MVDQLRVRLLGGLTVEGLGERELGSLKGRRLLKALALNRGQPVSIDRLVEVVWGDEPPTRPGDQLGVLVSRLRSVFGADRIPRTDAGYALAIDWLDLDELDARVAEAFEALSQDRLGAARAAAEAATALLRGPVLPEEEGEWLAVERARALTHETAARRIAAEAAERAGDHAAATVAAEQALANDPYDEASLRVLMRAQAAAGRPASALAAFARLKEQLAEDLGVSPSPETRELHDAILLADEAVESDRSAQPRPSSLPGRERELAALDDLLAGAIAGHTATVAVEGEAGIGKSALIATWMGRVRPRALVLAGRCDPLGRDLPLQPIADAIASELAGRPESERLDLLGAETVSIGRLLGVDAAPDASEATVVADTEIGRARLFAAMLAVIVRLAGGRPTVVIVDDLHLAGSSTLSWLQFATTRMTRLALVVATRPVALPLNIDTTISLGPLDVDAVADVVGRERASELHSRSGGHPLLLTALATSGSTAATLTEAVEHRMGALGRADQTIRTAALLGTDIDLDLLSQVLRTPAVELIEHLELAASSGLLIERGMGFAFRHELERDVLEASAGSARRALVHREAARVMATRPDPDPLTVAIHARGGGEVSLATEWFTRAADVAMARYDVEAAIAHIDSALALGDAPSAHAARARALMAGGRFDEAAEHAERAVAGDGGASALEIAGWVAYYRRNYEGARALADEGVRRAEDTGLRVSCLALGGRVRHGAGDLADATSQLETAAHEDAPPEVRGLAAVWLAQARTHQGRPDDALALLDAPLVDPDRIAHPFAGLHGRFVRALALGQLGRVREALVACAALDTAIARSGEVGARMAAPAANIRAWLMRWSRRPAEADDLNEFAVSITDPTSSRSEAHYAALLDLADGRMLAGDEAGAAGLLERLAPIETWRGTMAWHQRHRWGLLRARLALLDDRRDEGAALAAGVAHDAASRGARRYELLALAIGALAGGEPASDLEQLDAVVRGLGECAVLDGNALVTALADAFGVDAWRRESERRAAMIDR